MDPDSEEEWRPLVIPDWYEPEVGEHDYEISSFGQVRSLKLGETNYLEGSIPRPKKKIKTPYHYTELCVDGRRKKFRTHRLVCWTFFPPCESFDEFHNKWEVHHGPLGSLDRRVTNLTTLQRQDHVKLHQQ